MEKLAECEMVLEKALDDEAAAEAVEKLIKKLPTAKRVKEEHREKVQEALDAYNKLTPEQKELVTAKNQQKLFDCCAALDIDHLGIEAYFAPKVFDLGDDIGDDGRQDVGADVRFGGPKKLARGSGFHKSLQDETMQGIFGSRRELAVGKRSGAA